MRVEKMPKDVKYYLGLPYTVIVRQDSQGDFVARVDELPGCSAHGKTQPEALEAVDEAKKLWITDCVENGDPVPEPSVDEGLPSGKWLQRVPRSLHRRLVLQAKREGVSLNQLVTSMLAEATGAKRTEEALEASGTGLKKLTEAWWTHLGDQEQPTHNWSIQVHRPNALLRTAMLRQRVCRQGGRKRNIFQHEELIHEKELAHQGR
jgi:antitoxin HicB